MLSDIIRSLLNSTEKQITKKQTMQEYHEELFETTKEFSNSLLQSPFMKIPVENGTLLVVSDLHIPYDLTELVEFIFEKHVSPNTILVINGDLFDMEALSSFPQARQSVFQEEYNNTLSLLKKWAPQFKQVVLVRGNHEDRLRKRLMKVPEFVQVSFLYEPDIFEVLREELAEHGITNIVNAASFGVMINDDLFIAHPTNYRRAPGSTVKATIEYILQFEKSVRYVIVGHTHRQALINHLGVKGYEQGCLCKPLPYESSGKITLIQQDRGYMVVEIRNYAVEFANLIEAARR